MSLLHQSHTPSRRPGHSSAVMRITLLACLPGIATQAWFFGWGVVTNVLTAALAAAAAGGGGSPAADNDGVGSATPDAGGGGGMAAETSRVGDTAAEAGGSAPQRGLANAVTGWTARCIQHHALATAGG